MPVIKVSELSVLTHTSQFQGWADLPAAISFILILTLLSESAAADKKEPLI